MQSRPSWVTVVGFALVISSGVDNANATLIIDDFEAGGFSVSNTDSFCPPETTPEPCNSLETGLPVPGGNRAAFSRLAGFQTTGSVTSILMQTSANDAVAVSRSNTGGASFEYGFGVGSFSPIDLTEGGSINGFRIDVNSVSGRWIWNIVLKNGTGSGFGEAVSAGAAVGPISGLGSPFISFVQFSPDLDLTQVTGIRFSIGDFTDEFSTIEFDNFRTVVPEPSAGLLLATGLLGLAIRRRTH